MARLIKLNESLLDKHHHSTLRELGRTLGIKSPTSKVKSQLIQEILLFQEANEHADVFVKVSSKKTRIDLSCFFESNNTEEEITNLHSTELDFKGTEAIYKQYASLCFADSDPISEYEGRLEIYKEGFAFVRKQEYSIMEGDPYVSAKIIEKYGIRAGDRVKVLVKKAKDTNARIVTEVLTINDILIDCVSERVNFDLVTPLYPNKRFNLSKDKDLAVRCVDLLAPIGKGQRGSIIASSKTGKTTLLRKIAIAIEKYNPETKIFMLMLDVRPEEFADITDCHHCEVVQVSHDKSAENLLMVAEMILSKGKRIAETNNDVIIFIDSINELMKAHQEMQDKLDDVAKGIVDVQALKNVKKFLSCAKRLQTGGSLTIISTIDMDSSFDVAFYNEIRDTLNLEINLLKELSDRRLYPAIDFNKTYTIREDLLFNEKELNAVYTLRRALSDNQNATPIVIKGLGESDKLEEFIERIDSVVKPCNI